MTSTDEKIREEKLQYYINREKYQHYHKVILMNMNILEVKKYYLLIKVKQYNKLNLNIHLLEKHLKNKQRQLTIKDKSKLKQFKSIKKLGEIDMADKKGFTGLYNEFNIQTKTW